MPRESATVHNGAAFSWSELSPLPMERFREQILSGVAAGARLAALWACRDETGSYLLSAVLAIETESALQVLKAACGPAYAALTLDCPQAHWLERDLWEQTGIVPEGHPFLKPIRFASGANVTRMEQTAGEAGGDGAERAALATGCGIVDFFRMEGDEVHEVAVGPVHAGIIEPGHFRFQCHGETVYHLEISLGYQHRGVERALRGGPNRRTLHYVETLAGDTSVAHAIAYCRAVESLSATRVPARGQVIRGIALELERVANHIGDLGAMAGDVGYLPSMSYCGRIRGDVLNMTALLCGNRFGRGLVRPGGVAWDIDGELARELTHRARMALTDARVAIELLWDSPSVMARFDRAGTISRELCNRLGLVGVAARACGVPRDVRRDFPFGIYRFAQIPVSTVDSGDIFARAYVRWLEIQRSLAFVREQLGSLPAGKTQETLQSLPAHGAVVTLTEGWRGEVCHVVTTDANGCFDLYKVVDPSLHNWFGLAMAMRGQQISDFPLCNKSLNLSYCGHDL